MGNLPNDLEVRMLLTPLFIKRNWEQKGSLSWAPMTTAVYQELATERQLYKAYVAPLLCLTIIHSGPGGVKVSADAFTPPGSSESRNWMMKGKHQRGWGRTSGSFNDWSVMGMLLMRRAGIRGYASHVETDKPGRSLMNNSAEQSQSELCRPQECGMNRVWLWGRQRWHCEWAAPLFLFLFLLLPERRWQLSGEDQNGGRWKVSGSGRNGEKRETVAPGGYISSQ